jgi:hypothetical protein
MLRAFEILEVMAREAEAVDQRLLAAELRTLADALREGRREEANAAELIQGMVEEARNVGEHVTAGELSAVAGALRIGDTSRAILTLSTHIAHMDHLYQQESSHYTKKRAGSLLLAYRAALLIIKGVRHDEV